MGAPTITTRPDVDLLDPTFHVGDPHPAYAWMRRHEPLYRDRNGLWCVTRIEHLKAVERRARTFVSSRGYRSVWFPDETSMISKDDPAHSEQRALVADRFTPRAVGELEDQIRELAVTAFDLVGVAPQLEVVDGLAARIPSIVTCRLLGWPDDTWRDVRSWSERLMRVDMLQRDPSQLSGAVRAMNEIAVLTEATVAPRRGCPAHDLLSRWANAELDGETMTLAEINSELGLVIPGGAETTRTTISRAMIMFTERNDLWEQLAEQPALIPSAVEELLRWITPLNNMFRTAAEDTELDGVRIAAGDRLALVYPSANRDEAVFDRADEIDFSRHPNPHVAFGFGPHFCLGAHLARLTLRVVLEEWTSRVTRLRAVEPPVYEANVFVKAVERFELAFDRR